MENLFRLLDAGYSVLFEKEDAVFRVTASRCLRVVTGAAMACEGALRHAADAVLGGNTIEIDLTQGE